MEIICSPLGFMDISYPEQGAIDIAAAGFQNILLDLSMGFPDTRRIIFGQSRKQIRPEELSHAMRLVMENIRLQNLRVPVVRAPFLGRNTKQQDPEKVLVQLTEESIRICGGAGCRYLIVRPFSQDMEFYLQLAGLAEENQVMLLLENSCRDFNGHLGRGLLSDASEAAGWVDELNSRAGGEIFGFCMDVGACSQCGQDMQNFAAVLGKRIKTVFVRDIDGHGESSMLPFTSVGGGQPKTDWIGLIRGLREIRFGGQLVLEAADTAAAFPPALRPALLKLARSAAGYLEQQIELEASIKKYSSLVLFGAGNLCRHYMKSYGEAYPPLFTCDNNRSLWGRQACGLEVRPPESLRSLPEDCAVLICCASYRDIEKQLRDMGIRNPIEFFDN